MPLFLKESAAFAPSPVSGCPPALSRQAAVYHAQASVYALVPHWVFHSLVLSADINARNPGRSEMGRAPGWRSPHLSAPVAALCSPNGVCLDYKADRSGMTTGVQEDRDSACRVLLWFFFYSTIITIKCFFPTQRWLFQNVLIKGKWSHYTGG